MSRDHSHTAYSCLVTIHIQLHFARFYSILCRFSHEDMYILCSRIHIKTFTFCVLKFKYRHVHSCFGIHIKIYILCFGIHIKIYILCFKIHIKIYMLCFKIHINMCILCFKIHIKMCILCFRIHIKMCILCFRIDITLYILCPVGILVKTYIVCGL
jgi:hypothetical protein